MANTDHTRKLLVRSVLVTGVTVSTMIGAQSLAMLDNQQALNANSGTVPPQGTTLVAEVSPMMIQVKPSIVILRRPRQSPAVTTNGSAAPSNLQQIALPQAQLLPAPQPIIVPAQQQVVQNYSAPAQGQPAQPVPQPIPQPTQPSR